VLNGNGDAAFAAALAFAVASSKDASDACDVLSAMVLYP
jgi:hypothetical protein